MLWASLNSSLDLLNYPLHYPCCLPPYFISLMFKIFKKDSKEKSKGDPHTAGYDPATDPDLDKKFEALMVLIFITVYLFINNYASFITRLFVLYRIS